MRVWLRGLVLASIFALVVAGCGGGGDSDKSTTTTTASTSSAAAVNLSKDDLNRNFTAPANPQRIVAMSPTIVELMYAVGVTPVGRPNSANYPEAARTLPDFGSSYTPVAERIVAMKPDLIIADAIIDAGPNMDALAALGVPVYALRVTSFDDVVRGLRTVGALTGKQAAGDAQAQALTAKMDGIKAKLPATGPSFAVLVLAGPGQFIAEKDGSYLSDVLKQLRARNLVTNEPDNFRFPGFTDYSPELIVQKNPDVIITMSLGGAPGTPTTIASIKADAAMSSLPAVKNNRIVEVNQEIYLQSAGPRVSVMLDELPKLLYPTVFN